MNAAAPQNKKPKQRYTTTNWHEYDAALTARGSLLVWLDKDMQWLAEPAGDNGRPAKYTDAAIQFCLSIKVCSICHCDSVWAWCKACCN